MSIKHLILTLLLLHCTVSLSAQSTSHLLQKKIELPTTRLTVQELFHCMAENGITLSYSSNYIDLNRQLIFKEPIASVEALLSAFLPRKRFQQSGADKIVITPPTHRIISGYVKDSETSEPLIGVLLYDPVYKIKTLTNNYGHFTLTIPFRSSHLLTSLLGYESQKITLPAPTTSSFSSLDISLTQSVFKLSEVVVMPEVNPQLFSASMIDFQADNNDAYTMGVNDVIYQLQNDPAVSSNGLFQPLSIRSDRLDNNLMLLDGVKVYHYQHLFSLYSIFDTQSIKKSTLHKGYFPVQYTGALSGIVDVRTKEGNKQKFSGNANIDLLTSSVLLEGPIKKECSSLLLSARRMWIDPISFFSLDQSDQNSFHISAFDLFLKASVKCGWKHNFQFSTYFGGDKFKLSADESTPKEQIKWNTLLSTVRWAYSASPRFFIDTNLSFSMLRNNSISLSQYDSSNSFLESRIANLSLASNGRYLFSEKSSLNFGYQINYQTNLVPNITHQAVQLPQYSSHKEFNLESVLYFGGEYSLGKATLVGGLNMSYYHHKSYNHLMAQPRVQFIYHANSQLNIYAACSLIGRYNHQLTVDYISTPYELHIPSSRQIKPSQSLVYELGSKGQLLSNLHYSATLYYKKLSHLLHYRATQNIGEFEFAPLRSNRVVQGDAKGWGAEFNLKYKSTHLDLNFSYSYSKFMERYPDAFFADSYLSSLYNRPHRFSGNVVYAPFKKSSFILQLTLTSGQLMEYPVFSLPTADQLAGLDEDYERNSNYYAMQRQKRLPPLFQMNLGYNFKINGFTSSSHFLFKTGIYNMVNKNNTIFTETTINSDKVEMMLTQFSTLLPYLGVSYKF